MNRIIFPNEKAINPMHEPWSKIPTGSLWTNPGRQHGAHPSIGVLALQGTAPRRGQRKTERVTAPCSLRASPTGGASEMRQRQWTEAAVGWSSVAARVEHGEANLGHKMLLVEGGESSWAFYIGWGRLASRSGGDQCWCR
jgi:hypothetical protein